MPKPVHFLGLIAQGKPILQCKSLSSRDGNDMLIPFEINSVTSTLAREEKGTEAEM